MPQEKGSVEEKIKAMQNEQRDSLAALHTLSKPLPRTEGIIEGRIEAYENVFGVVARHEEERTKQLQEWWNSQPIGLIDFSSYEAQKWKRKFGELLR